ncbi:hypothetical protein ONE63_010711 [Megalurothrips usitatus]|uniref:Uncharacterized protein n=1 Tax=Megalurothrips usitatus TaxID=439358 RepID=A0AAV7XDU9_9NEOP|nr:hypothetical protein ONE63_010711 [Megalurothrips usitatus]
MSEGFVQTKSSLAREVKPAEFEEVVFNSYKRKPSDESSSAPVMKRNRRPDPIPKPEDVHRTFMKRARHDIIKFGMTGFDATQKQQTKEALAISLGAKPRKKKGMNYKELKEQLKKQKVEDKADVEFQSIGKTADGHASAKIKNRMRNSKQKPRGDSKGGILNVYGKVKKQDLPQKGKGKGKK